MAASYSYTPAMVAKLRAAQPLNQAKAIALAKELRVPQKSIISKCNALKLAYDCLAPRKINAKIARITKADYVDAIAKALSMPADELVGLEKSTARSLSNLLMNIS